MTVLGQNPNVVNVGPKPDARPKPNAESAGPKSAGPEPDAGLKPNARPKPNAVNAGPKSNVVNAGSKSNAVNVGPESDAGPKPIVVNAGLKPDAEPKVGPNLNAGPKPDVVNAGLIGKCKNCESKDAQGLAEICAFDHAVMLSVSKKLVSVSLTWEEVKTAGGLPAIVGITRLSCGVGGRDELGFWSQHISLWGSEDCGWSTREGWHNSPIVRGGWPGWTTSGHSTSRYGEVKTVGSLPAKVGTTRLSCGVGGRDGRPLVIVRLTMER
ncbi:hypothetical protein CRG98_013745 [Punica granatum]|uniref:Uncharacterized protein n=1 Tax=Punica granatum TaxID=22663 RepID=A0A2I0KBE2_PUNGR|nr:hypothetical protein CRG98_013745 [Punica granatum]